MIEIDEFTYPRPQLDTQNIRVLVEKLKAGIKLDPIEVQKVKTSEKERTILTNGAHRLEAYKEFNKLDDYKSVTEVSVEYWKTEVLDYEKNKDDILTHSFNTNDKQGLNMRIMDTHTTARRLRREHPDWTAKYIGKRIHRAQQTISGHISDIIQEQSATEHQLIMRLKRLGWTNQEISNVTKLSLSAPDKIYKNTGTSKIINFYRRQRKAPEKIGEMFDIDVQTVWSIILDGKSDQERFELLDFQPKVYDVWNYSGCNKLMGQEYPGQIPGQIVLNALYYHTKQGYLVVDLMAGGGTTNDACLLMGRKCYSYDINPPENRKDIIQHNFLNGLPERAKKASLIFLDPPYFKKKEIEYGSESISALDREDYLESMDKLAEICEGHKVAFVMGKYYDYENPRDSIFMAKYVNIFENHSFRQIDRISINQPPPEGGQHAVNSAKEGHRMEILARDLLIFG